MTVAELIGLVCGNMPNAIPESSFVNWINILEDSIYSTYIKDREKPEPKKVENMGTDELALEKDFGLRWRLIYEYYLYAQICILNEEFAKANNYIFLYNEQVNEFVKFYYSNMENEVRARRLRNFR